MTQADYNTVKESGLSTCLGLVTISEQADYATYFLQHSDNAELQTDLTGLTDTRY